MMGILLCKPRCMAALAAFTLSFVLQATASAGVAVIGNTNLSVNSITPDEAANIFLGRMTRLADGTSPIAFDNQAVDVKNEFYSKVVGKSGSQLKAYWAKLIFTGEGNPPKEYPDDKSVIENVAATPGAIGYVNDSSVDKSVKILLKAK